MVRRVQISVVGHNEETCTRNARDSAYRVGKVIAAKGAVVVCGGLGGVMKAACQGARDGGGTSIGIVPSDDLSQANKYCDYVVATDLGHTRNFLVAYSGEAMVVVGGGAGTLVEMTAAYQAGRPVVAVKGTGGVADEYAGKFVDDRRTARVLGASSPEDAVEKAMKLAKAPGGRKAQRAIREER